MALGRARRPRPSHDQYPTVFADVSRRTFLREQRMDWRGRTSAAAVLRRSRSAGPHTMAQPGGNPFSSRVHFLEFRENGNVVSGPLGFCQYGRDLDAARNWKADNLNSGIVAILIRNLTTVFEQNSPGGSCRLGDLQRTDARMPGFATPFAINIALLERQSPVAVTRGRFIVRLAVSVVSTDLLPATPQPGNDSDRMSGSHQQLRMEFALLIDRHV